jgi:hypothetical protein
MGRLVPTISIVLDTAGEQRARHAARDEPVPPFECQQAQRREVGAVVRLRQALERGVCLAAVRRADIERDAALQLARGLEGVRVALEREFGVQAVERVELGNALLPAVLRAAACGLQFSQRLRPRTLGLQTRQQRVEVAGFVRGAARDQR